MSQFLPSLNFVLDNEDRQRAYATVPDAPPGARAISGINSMAYPADFSKIAAVPPAQRGPLVAQFYLEKFWNPLNVSGVQNQDLVNRVVDESVNGGERTGPLMLQIAANACGSHLIVDGCVGPDTVSVVNSLPQDPLLSAYRAARVNHYNLIAARNPADQKYLAQWIARANQ